MADIALGLIIGYGYYKISTNMTGGNREQPEIVCDEKEEKDNLPTTQLPHNIVYEHLKWTT